jgi:hypothetical protein
MEIYQQLAWLGYQNGYLTPFVEICAPLGPGLYPDYGSSRNKPDSFDSKIGQYWIPYYT